MMCVDTHWLDEVRFDAQGLIPAIAQHRHTGRVLMVAWMNRDSLIRTAELRQAVYWSRSRQRLWHKGEESGHHQQVHEIRLDCDGDVIVLQVEQHGGIACHTGRESCFYRVLTPQGWQVVDAIAKDPAQIYGPSAASAPSSPVSTAPAAPQTHETAMDAVEVLQALGQIMQARKQASPDSSYVASLYHKGLNKILEKVGEEATETILAAKDAQPDALDDLIYETADLWFHSIVMLGQFNVAPQAIIDELARRQGLSGLVEKAARPSS